MSDFSHARGRSEGAARQASDLAQTVIDDRVREADVFRTARAAKQADSGRDRSKPTAQSIPVTIRPRRRPHIPIIHRGIAGLDPSTSGSDR
jgi:hypothetical protein